MPRRAEGMGPLSFRIASKTWFEESRLTSDFGVSLMRFACGQIVLDLGVFKSAEGVLHEHGNRHGTHAPGDGSHVAGKRSDRVVIDIAYEAVAAFGIGVFNAVDADVNNGDAFFDHVCSYKMGSTNRSDKEVGLASDGGEVAGTGMADRDSGVAGNGFAHHEESGGFADDLAAPEDDHVFAFGFDAAAFDEFNNARRRTGDKSACVFLAEFADVDGVESVDVFVGSDAVKGFGFVEVFWEGRLHENTADGGVGVERVNACEEFVLRDVFGQEV